MQCLVVAEESTGDHPVQALILVDLQLEVAHQEIGEVIFGHLEQQLVLVHRVRLVDEHEEELLITLGTEGVADRRIPGQCDITPRPQIANVKLSTVQSATFLYTLDDHTCQRTDLTLRIFLNHLLQTFHTPVAITCVQKTQAIDEDKLCTVSALWESTLR